MHPGRLGRIGAGAFRRRGWVLAGWIAALAVAFGLSAAFGGDLVNGSAPPDSDSAQAQALLRQGFPALSGDAVRVVVRTADVRSADVQQTVRALLAELHGLPHVTSVDDPYAGTGAITPDGRTLTAAVHLDVVNPNDMPVADTRRMLTAAAAAERDGLHIAVGGRAVQTAESGQSPTEAIGLAAAAIILLLTFGSVVAAGLPLALAIGSVAVISGLIGLAAAIVDVPSFAPILGSALGIALGIDYALLMVTRFRESRAAGLDPQAATAATLDSAGRSVLVAASTVMVSMLGLFTVGLPVMDGTAAVSIIATLVVMGAAVTLFPALLGFLGTHIDRLRLRPVRPSSGTGWIRWSGLVQRHRVLATVGGVVVLLALALPFLGVHFGLPDEGNSPRGSSSRRAYDMISEGFGPGASGPLLVVADISGSGRSTMTDVRDAAVATQGVRAVSPPVFDADGRLALLSVVPTTGPQDEATENLVRTLRHTLIRPGTVVHVGGSTAANIDINTSITDRLAPLIGSVIVVSTIVLMMAFRSVLIAVTAAVMNLLSVAAAYGVVAYVLRGGWAGRLIGIDTPTPMAAFVPVIMFALLFGLSMDYEVFLISRMREAWVRTPDNARAVTSGLAGTGRVITAAAAIMLVVFAAIIPSDQVFIKVFGVGMVAAVLVDATVIRMLLVPAVMHMFGRANWWLPARPEPAAVRTT